MKKWFKRIALLVLILLVLAASGLAGLYLSDSWEAEVLKKYIKYDYLGIPTETQAAEVEGLGKKWTSEMYIDTQKAYIGDFDTARDNKRVYMDGSVTRLVNYPDGYQMDFPTETLFDFTRSDSVIEGSGDGYSFTVSLERCPYPEMTEEMTEGLAQYVPWFQAENATEQYIGFYQSRFLLNETWQENNDVTVTRPERFDANGYDGMIFHAVMDEVPEEKYDAYSYIYITLEDQQYLRVLVRYHSGDEALRASLTGLFRDFRTFAPVGTAGNFEDCYPVLPEDWTVETSALYNQIAASTEVHWGIYTTDVYGTGIRETIPALEEKLDYSFQTILSYVHYNGEFPMDFLQENWEKGRIVELTYQLTSDNNQDMFTDSVLLDIYRGQGLERIREFARNLKEFGHPVLFRMNNEMNSDWTSYGGVVNMCDPQIFVEVYQTIYEIFQEEGAANCIWIYNPNDRNAPPSKWNDAVNYYPGNEYTHMIGVTGYNNGTYYTQWREEWREFDVIYDQIQWLYGDIYGAFPWIITEFSSSSIGGDKAAWIENMFVHMENYPNIKIAVWFSSADWDAEGNVSRPYWLDETDETTEAFRKGLEAYSSAPWDCTR